MTFPTATVTWRPNASTLLVLAAAVLAAGGASASLMTAPVGHRAPQSRMPAPAATAGTTTVTSDSSQTTAPAPAATPFGQLVKAQVATCKQQAATAGKHGVGACVNAWVTTHNPGHTGTGGGG